MSERESHSWLKPAQSHLYFSRMDDCLINTLLLVVLLVPQNIDAVGLPHKPLLKDATGVKFCFSHEDIHIFTSTSLKRITNL